MTKKNQEIQSRKFSGISNDLIEKINNYDKQFYNVELGYFTEQNKKDIFLFILEVSHKDPQNEYITMVETKIQSSHLSFEGKLQSYLNISIDDFERFKSNDRIFKIKYDNILKARLQDSLKKSQEQLSNGTGDVAETNKRIAAFKLLDEISNRDDKNISTSLPIKAYQAFHWECLINDRDVLVSTIQDIVNNVVLLRAKELLNNTQLSDDGTEVLVNKEYNMPIEIIYNGENIANECEIKNIDNIQCPSHDEPVNNAWELLGGVMVSLRNELLSAYTAKDIAAFKSVCSDFHLLDETDVITRWEDVSAMLQRPFRVCGMVKNEGMPGGGPFWVSHEGVKTKQIIEKSQIDSIHLAKLTESSHFNPVMMAISPHDLMGNKLDLTKFVREDLSMAVKKNHLGKTVYYLEKPGLWNGSMYYWNTIFVEIPSNVFSPVKNVMDLLNPSHCC